MGWKRAVQSTQPHTSMQCHVSSWARWQGRFCGRDQVNHWTLGDLSAGAACLRARLPRVNKTLARLSSLFDT
eukprot:9123081-Alexandrium_andersonii.AAC.1